MEEGPPDHRGCHHRDQKQNSEKSLKDNIFPNHEGQCKSDHILQEDGGERQ